MKNAKRFFLVLFFVSMYFTVSVNLALADVSLTIRDGSTKIFENSVPLPPSGTIDIPDNTGEPHTVNAQSVLSLLNSADISSDSFSISNLEYYPSFGSLYLKCITGGTGEKCDNWQYTVNGEYPQSGMDQETLRGDETVYLYFGDQHRLTLSSNSINSSDAITIQSEDYDYENNSWTGRTGVTIGITQPNPDDEWNPIEIQTGEVDSNGSLTFSSIPAGSYNVGVKEDFYFPTESLMVTIPNVSGSYSGSYVRASIEHPPKNVIEEVNLIFDVKKAFAFLISKQKESGSFGEDLYTDWSTLALSSDIGYQTQKMMLIKYMTENKISGSILTDFERRAMTLMALGLNPYDTGGENYILKIVDSFDGKQFGDPSLYNDDIFALITLSNAGFTENDEMINEDISFVLSKQEADGSWSKSPDITGVAIGALTFVKMNKSIENSILRARDFLKNFQKEDGGFGNPASPSWAMEGIMSLGEKPEDWKHSTTGKTPLDYLALNQDSDGGVKNENGDENSKIWNTAYVLTAMSGKTWSEIMYDFPKQVTQTAQLLTSNTRVTISQGALKPDRSIIKNKQEKKEKEKIQNKLPENTKMNVIVPEEQKEIKTVEKSNWFINLLKIIFGFR